jgi:hypothetical protein
VKGVVVREGITLTGDVSEGCSFKGGSYTYRGCE